MTLIVCTRICSMLTAELQKSTEVGHTPSTKPSPLSRTVLHVLLALHCALTSMSARAYRVFNWCERGREGHGGPLKMTGASGEGPRGIRYAWTPLVLSSLRLWRRWSVGNGGGCCVTKAASHHRLHSSEPTLSCAAAAPSCPAGCT